MPIFITEFSVFGTYWSFIMLSSPPVSVLGMIESAGTVQHWRGVKQYHKSKWNNELMVPGHSASIPLLFPMLILHDGIVYIGGICITIIHQVVVSDPRHVSIQPTGNLSIVLHVVYECRSSKSTEIKSGLLISRKIGIIPKESGRLTLYIMSLIHVQIHACKN